MLEILWAVFSFIIAVSLLVTVHEFGHFYVARCVGVKVLRFSIGFGKALYRRQCQSGVEFVIAAIPLGGYVKMLDEREGEVDDADLPYAFNRQSIWRRIAIILAGPLFNVLFAILAYWAIFVIGVTHPIPLVGHVAPQSIAEQAGIKVNDEVISIDGEAVDSWQSARLQLFSHLGEEGRLPITIKRGEQEKRLSLDLAHWQVDEHAPRPLHTLGITPYYPPMPFTMIKVLPDSPAEVAGLQPGDTIIAINGQAFTQLPLLIETISDNVGQDITLTIDRDGVVQPVVVRVEPISDAGSVAKGRIGVQFDEPEWPEAMQSREHYSVWSAWLPALQKTWDMTVLSFSLLGKMVVGELSIKSMSGPVGIAQGAGYSASLGFVPFLAFLAIVSISLAIINILPIPILDGGHLLYCLFELVFRKPVPEKVQVAAVRVGFILLLALMVVAFYNDIARW